MNMSKWGIGVGEEFPTEEIHRDENGVVHHHHYYRRRRPFGFVRFFLSVMLIILVFRAFHYVRLFDWDLPFLPWVPHGYLPFAGTLMMILIVGGLLYFLRCQDQGTRH
jgi:hypothetical protein